MRVPVKNGRIRKIAVLPLEFSFQEDFFDEPEKKALKQVFGMPRGMG